MNRIVVFSSAASPRLTYVLDWLLRERLQLDYIIVNERAGCTDCRQVIAYGDVLQGAFSIPADPFLSATGIGAVIPVAGERSGIPTLFHSSETRYSVPFDIFSAVFYLLSRYEEYLPFSADHHGRFPPEESILFKNEWLKRPIVDEWVSVMGFQLSAIWGFLVRPEPGGFQPTYDIDIAYSHIFKGFKRIAGAYLKAIIKGDLVQINERTQVLQKKKQDPFDSFGWMRQQHTQHGLKPIYFVLCALKRSDFDKNIHPRHPAMIRVIKQLAREGETGIHPSYFATRYDIVAKEKDTLEQVAGRSVAISRQHYIKLHIPATCHLLIDNQIKDDYSMGYGSMCGFRAGTGSSFLWYDLQNERISPLRIHPFCFMDTTAHFDMGLSPTEAFELLRQMADKIKETNSTLITVFHNFSLGTAKEWDGWHEAYEQFLDATAKRN